jgi:hypothetical protein
MHRLRYLAIFLLVILSFSAFFGGGLLIKDKSGQILKLDLDWLQDSPFKNYLIPGLILFILIGMGSLATVLTGMIGKRFFPAGTIICGAMLTIWITVQMLMFQSMHPLQITFLLLGILLILIGWKLMKHRKHTGHG